MNSKAFLLIALGSIGAAAVLGQAPAPPAAPAAPQHGPGVQAPADSEYANFIAMKCKNPPAPRGGGRGGAGGGRAATTDRPTPRDYTIAEIPGVVAAGQKWKSIWTGTGNNADGIIATNDGGILAAQNTNSDVMKIDKDGKVSFPYKDTNTGGALSMNKKGDLFVVSRGLPTSVWQLAPKRQRVADTFNGEPLDCIGGVINDVSADSKGGVYFTFGGVYYINPKGVVSRQGTLTGTNGIILSPDEKKLYVTGRLPSAQSPAGQAPAPPAEAGRGGRGGAGGGLVSYDVQADGSLTNERQFATVGGDGTAVDAIGRIYTTTQTGITVLAPDGKVLGEIQTPLFFITVAFSGPDKKTLYGVANDQRFDEIFTLPMIAQGYKGRAK